eukprot:3994518-Prymnesium_polylepis.2
MAMEGGIMKHCSAHESRARTTSCVQVDAPVGLTTCWTHQDRFGNCGSRADVDVETATTAAAATVPGCRSSRRAATRLTVRLKAPTAVAATANAIGEKLDITARSSTAWPDFPPR